MLTSLLRAAVRRLEKRYDYDAGYLHDLAKASPKALMAFSGVQKLAGFRQGAPPQALAAASLVATMAEDCGPCVQIGVKISQENGVSPTVLRGVLIGNFSLMGPRPAWPTPSPRRRWSTTLGLADPLRDEVVRAGVPRAWRRSPWPWPRPGSIPRSSTRWVMAGPARGSAWTARPWRW
jgi:hypothetical protein